MHSFPDEGTFPHYEMAVDADDDTASAVMLDKKGAGTFKKRFKNQLNVYFGLSNDESFTRRSCQTRECH